MIVQKDKINTPLKVFNIIVAIIMIAPLFLVVLTSFTPKEFYEIPVFEWSLRWYKTLMRSTGFIRGFSLSFVLALVAGFFSLLIGFFSAFAMVRYDFKGKTLADALFMSPLTVPAVCLGIALLQFFIKFNIFNTFFGLLMGHIVITVPYIIKTAGVSLRAVSKDMELAAMNLGATWGQSFLYITMPLIRPGLISGYIFAFLISFGEVALTLFIIGPSYQTLPVRIFNYMFDINTPVIAAISTLLILFSIVLMVVLDKLFGLKNLLN